MPIVYVNITQLSNGDYRILESLIANNKSRATKKNLLSMFGKISAKLLIHKVYGIPLKEINFQYSSNGKPEIEKYENLKFNISHSNNIVVVATSIRDIGIDIECEKKDLLIS